MPRKKNPRGPSAGVLAAISARLSEACHEVTICQWLEDLTPRFLHHPRNLVTVVTVGKDNGFRAHVVATSRHETAPTVRGRDVQPAGDDCRTIYRGLAIGSVGLIHVGLNPGAGIEDEVARPISRVQPDRYWQP